MRVLIIEDEKYVADRLINLLNKIDFQYQLQGIIKRVDKAIDWLRNNEMPDLIFADIQLLDGESFKIFEQVEVSSFVIFTTSYNEYAIKAFQVNSIDYLLKPITESKLKAAINKLMKLQNIQNKESINDLLKLMRNQHVQYKKRFLVKSGKRLFAIPVEEIAYFYVEDKVTLLKTSNNKNYYADFSLEEIDDLVNPERFFRINRQMIVSLDSIMKISTFFNSRLILNLKPEYSDDVIVTRSKVSDFKKWLDR